MSNKTKVIYVTKENRGLFDIGEGICQNSGMEATNETFTQTTNDRGVFRRYRFDNGYMASVVSHAGSYGGDQGLWELAVMTHDGTIVYDTPVTADVLGWLSDAEMLDAVRQVRMLPPRRVGGDGRLRPIIRL